jgi:hypothetical protein
MQRSPKDIAVVGASTDMFSNPEQIKTIQILRLIPDIPRCAFVGWL